MSQGQQAKRQRLQAEPIMVKTIMAKEFFRPANSNLMLVWGVPKSKTSKALDWTNCTTKATYRTVVVKFKCHRPKCPTVDINVMYREDFPREGRQLRVGEEEVGMFIITDLLARLKERNMLQLGNKVIIWPVEGCPNTFRSEIAPSICPYCEQPMESGEFVECEGCDAHAHKQCVPCVWAEDEGQKTAGAPHQPFKFACPSCEAREPAISYSETCTMQTTNQNGHAAGLRAGINPLKRPMPGMDAPLPPQQQTQQQQQQQQQIDGAGLSRPSPLQPTQPSSAAAAARRQGGPVVPPGPHTTPPPQRPQAAGAVSQGQNASTPPVSALRALGNNSSSPAAAAGAPGAKASAGQPQPPPSTATTAAQQRQQQQQQQQQQHARRRGDGAPEGAATSVSGRKPGSADSPAPNDATTPARASRPGQQQQAGSQGAGAPSGAKHRAQAQPPGPPPQPSPASQQQHTPPLAGRGPTPSGAGTPRTDGPLAGRATPGSADVAARMKAPDSQRSANIIARMAKLRQDVDEHIAEIEGLREEMDEVKQELSASKAANASLEAAQAPLQAENAELKEQIAALKAGGSSQAEVEAARKDAAAARASATESSNRAQELEKQLQQVQSQLDQQTKQSQAAEERRAAAQAALEQAEAALNLERANSAGQAADLEAYRQRCAELDAELKALEEATMDGME